MINALDFINSDDIRNYWKEIGYQPTPRQTAWLIWQSDRHSLNEKHQAFKQLIEETGEESDPDLPVFLSNYMSLENEMVELFYSDSVILYCCRQCWEPMYYENTDACFYTSLRAVIDHIKELSSHGDCLRSQVTGYLADKSEDNAQTVSLFFNPDTTIHSIDWLKTRNTIISGKSQIKWAFGKMWFNFPVPFRRGEVICQKGYDWTGSHRMIGQPEVVKETRYDYCNNHPEFAGKGYGDMSVYSYYVEENGQLELESHSGLMNCEYYRQPLTGAQRQLAVMSSFLKGEINEHLLILAIQKIREEDDSLNFGLYDYDEEILIKFGILEN
ncbi:MAG: hypothetical protein IJM79_01175 [Erysipelotrichaceae bacterium]|nr:hypothetical protein [Erysipelotrichaceae bacterium]